MSNTIFPTLLGLGWTFDRAPKFNNVIQEAVSGAQTAIGLWLYPKAEYTLNYDMLRADSNLEFQTLYAFFCMVRGRFDTFLFEDTDDYSVVAQALGDGDDAQLDFQLVRTMQGKSGYAFVEPIIAPNTVSHVYIDGVEQMSGWAVSSAGVITFDVAPGAGLAVTATFTYYWRCRFLDEIMTYSKFVSQIYSVSGLRFETCFNG